MHRLVIALTALLTLVGAAVVAGYLFLLAPSVDRAATMAPATSVAYVSVYLSPSTGQGLELADLLTRLPGLTDASTLADKLDQIIQRSLSGAGVDYHADVKPWLGDQLAIAFVPAPAASGPLPVAPVILAAVRDEAAARGAMNDIAGTNGTTLTTTSYHGVTVNVLGTGAGGFTASYAAIVNATLLVSADETALQAAIDAATGNAARLADASSYRGAMATLPTDRLASVYVDASAAELLGTATGASTSLTTAGLAIIARPGGLQVVGSAHLEPGASPSVSAVGASAPSDLTDWMPASTEAEAVVFGARQVFETLTTQLDTVPGGQSVAQSIAQLRALAALGLGIDVDRDLLPLFDGASAIAVQGLSGTAPHGQLVLRPSDAGAAADALTRITDGLRSRGAAVTQEQADGATITVVAIPQVAQVAYALQDGVLVAGLRADDVVAALDAHASGETLGTSAGYRAAFEVAGGRAGNEVYVAGARGVELLLGLFGQSTSSLSADLRDILNQVSAVAISTPATQNTIEIHATVTVH